jgi:hypothetical protein
MKNDCLKETGFDPERAVASVRFLAVKSETDIYGMSLGATIP